MPVVGVNVLEGSTDDVELGVIDDVTMEVLSTTVDVTVVVDED